MVSFLQQPDYQRGNTKHLHVFCEGEKLKATRQSYYGKLEKKLEEMNALSNEIIERGSNDSTATSLLDCEEILTRRRVSNVQNHCVEREPQVGK